MRELASELKMEEGGGPDGPAEDPTEMKMETEVDVPPDQFV